MATVKLTCSKDVSISEQYSSKAYTAADRLAFGRGAASGDRYYALLGFSSLSLDPNLYEITKATLTVNKIDGAIGFSAAMNARAQRITSTWSESTTWSGRPSSTTSGQSAAKSMGEGHSGSVTFDVTDIVTAWQNGSGQYGIQLLQSDSTASRIKTIADRTSSNAAYITVTYGQRVPAPTAPTVTAPGTITTDSATFKWSASTDHIFDATDLKYQLQVSLDGGSTWGSTISTDANTTNYTVNLRSMAGLSAGQYYYNAKLKVRVRAVTPAFNGTVYYSSWAISAAGVINYKITPSAPSSLTIEPDSAHEGQNVNITFGRPALYNVYDSSGDSMILTYTAKLKDGTVLGSVAADASEASISTTVILPQKTSGIADLITAMVATVTDAENQTSAPSAEVALTIKRYRSPMATVAAIDRQAESAAVTVLVSDTGYGAGQNNSQIAAVEYSLGSNSWVAVTPTWVGLKTVIELTGLSPGTRYTLQVRITNVAPSGMDARSGITGDTIILEHTPAAMIYRDSTAGTTGVAAKSLLVSKDWGQTVPEGDAYVEGTLTAAALSIGGDWVDLTLADGFKLYADAAYNQPRYRVCGNVITVVGCVTPEAEVSPGLTRMAIVSGIPEQYRPATTLYFVCQGSGMNRWNCSAESTDGTVRLSRYGTTEATTVPAGAWLPFCVTYMI